MLIVGEKCDFSCPIYSQLERQPGIYSETLTAALTQIQLQPAAPSTSRLQEPGRDITSCLAALQFVDGVDACAMPHPTSPYLTLLRPATPLPWGGSPFSSVWQGRWPVSDRQNAHLLAHRNTQTNKNAENQNSYICGLQS